MADSQRLRLTLRRNGHQFPPVEVSADPKDLDALQVQLVEMAREQDGRRDHGFAWQHEYFLLIESPDRPWVEPFEIQGKDLD